MIKGTCMHCRKPVQHKKAGDLWMHTESKVKECNPGDPDSHNAFVLPAGMRMMIRTRTTVLGDDGKFHLP